MRRHARTLLLMATRKVLAQVLMATRAPGHAARKAAVAVLAALAKRLGSNYLPLLPEALPFLAELLEDVEPQVRAAASQLVLQLEGLSGERLDSFLKA